MKILTLIITMVDDLDNDDLGHNDLDNDVDEGHNVDEGRNVDGGRLVD